MPCTCRVASGESECVCFQGRWLTLQDVLDTWGSVFLLSIHYMYHVKESCRATELRERCLGQV